MAGCKIGIDRLIKDHQLLLSLNNYKIFLLIISIQQMSIEKQGAKKSRGTGAQHRVFDSWVSAMCACMSMRSMKVELLILSQVRL